MEIVGEHGNRHFFGQGRRQVNCFNTDKIRRGLVGPPGGHSL